MDEQSLLCDSKICRLCAERNNNVICIFTTDENATNLPQLINRYLPIVVEKEDIFPKNICPGCHIQLEATKMFMDLIVTGQSKLRELFKKQNRQAKTSPLENYLNDCSLYLANHELKLKAEGLGRPKKKRGRPVKKLIKEENQNNVEETIQENKEDEKSEEEEVGMEVRRKRKIRAPARFDGLVQGKELEDILKKEGVIDDVRDVSRNKEHIKTYAGEIIIGRTEGEYGEDLGIPIFVKQKGRAVNFKKDQIKKFKCQICSKVFIHEIKFNLHIKSHKIESVNVILMGGEDTVHLIKQEPTDILELTETIERTITNKTKEISSTEDISEFEIENLNIRTHNCMKCDKNLPSQETLTLHMREHNGNKKFTCEICGKVLQRSSSLLYHKEIEHNNQRFICNKCNKSFKHRQLLQRHQIVHSEKRPFICPICNATFKTQANLINHEAVHTKEKRFECTQCNQKFAHKTSLSLHQRWHEGRKPYTCEFCQKSFSQNGNLLEHKRIHTGEKPFFCEVCGKNFTTSSQLRIHVKRHTGEKPWKCEICDKSFLHRDTYKFHVRRHLNDRPHACPCGRAFTERWALKKHQRIHTGEKPYRCNSCHKAFADKSNLQKHMKLQKCVNNLNLELNTLTKTTSSSLRLTQLIDQQGNPISITTQDGQTVPIVTSGDDDSNIQGLMPDGTLVPIEISGVHERDFNEGITQTTNIDLLNNSNAGELILEDDLGSNTIQHLNSNNFQLLTNNDGEEVCLVTYCD